MSAIILFDGVCNLCNSSVQFIISHDKRAYFRFASLQSPIGQSLLAQYGLSADTIDSVVLIDKQQAYVRSSAAWQIAKQLDGIWKLLSVIKILPLSWRDWLYDQVADNRYHWFGRKDQCWLPSDDLKSRFL